MIRFRNLLPTLAASALLGSGTFAQDVPWQHFNGDLKAQKYSPLTQITPQNVGDLEVAWRTHTGDVWPNPHPRGSGMHMRSGPQPDAGTPPTVWSATPLFVNDTLYLGTPFYRIFALEPDTGAVKWTYDSKAVLEALTQPDLKNRGVAYWAAEAPVAGAAVPEARLHRHHGCQAALGGCRHRQRLAPISGPRV